ncbi:MAG TPA: head GIN domain-containing protein [Flavobacterium sp.]|nr:head GIN domain-containing protein [Flavobacterium sp.]
MLVSFKNGLIIFAAVALVSCNKQHHHTIKGNGNIITQKRDIDENFKSVEANSGIEVIIEQADRTKVLVEADDNLQNSIITKVNNGVLIISRKSGSYSSQNGQKVFITAPVIEELTANSASSIKTKNTLKGENINLNTSSAAKIEAQLSIDNIKANSSSASKIEIKGMALNLDAQATSASKIEAEDLLANTITAESSSGSKISIHPIVSLKADASSGGKIEYNNTPKQIEKSTSSGGDISQE